MTSGIFRTCHSAQDPLLHGRRMKFEVRPFSSTVLWSIYKSWQPKAQYNIRPASRWWQFYCRSTSLRMQGMIKVPGTSEDPSASLGFLFLLDVLRRSAFTIHFDMISNFRQHKKTPCSVSGSAHTHSDSCLIGMNGLSLDMSPESIEQSVPFLLCLHPKFQGHADVSSWPMSTKTSSPLWSSFPLPVAEMPISCSRPSLDLPRLTSVPVVTKTWAKSSLIRSPPCRLIPNQVARSGLAVLSHRVCVPCWAVSRVLYQRCLKVCTGELIQSLKFQLACLDHFQITIRAVQLVTPDIWSYSPFDLLLSGLSRWSSLYNWTERRNSELVSKVMTDMLYGHLSVITDRFLLRLHISTYLVFWPVKNAQHSFPTILYVSSFAQISRGWRSIVLSFGALDDDFPFQNGAIDFTDCAYAHLYSCEGREITYRQNLHDEISICRKLEYLFNCARWAEFQERP